MSLEFIDQSRKCDGGFHSLAVPLQEEMSLSLGEFHGLRALFVVVRHVVDSSLGLRMGYDLLAFIKAMRRPQCAGSLIGRKDLVACACSTIVA